MTDTIGVLVMAYGGPNSLEDVQPYLLDVRGYRETPPSVVAEIRDRYARIGGRSPIRELTERQASALQRALNHNGDRYHTFVGMRHWHPYIGAAVGDMERAGISRAVGLVMAPHYSRLSIDAYFKKVTEAGSSINWRPIRHWHLLPMYLDAMAERIGAGLERFAPEQRARVPVIFTAHSLPARILEWADPYPDQLRATASALAARLGEQPCTFAYQSAALTPDPWLGPDAGEVLASLAADGCRNALIAPIGFTSEHVEILFDIDIEYQEQAKQLDVHLERIEMLNDSPTLMAGLASLVHDESTHAGWT